MTLPAPSPAKRLVMLIITTLGICNTACSLSCTLSLLVHHKGGPFAYIRRATSSSASAMLPAPHLVPQIFSVTMRVGQMHTAVTARGAPACSASATVPVPCPSIPPVTRNLYMCCMNGTSCSLSQPPPGDVDLQHLPCRLDCLFLILKSRSKRGVNARLQGMNGQPCWSTDRRPQLEAGSPCRHIFGRTTLGTVRSSTSHDWSPKMFRSVKHRSKHSGRQGRE